MRFKERISKKQICVCFACVTQERIMTLACGSGLLAYYLPLGEPDLLRHRIYRSGGQEEDIFDLFHFISFL